MKPHSCARLFEVEARRDGRLLGAALASFERHLTACPVCQREVSALESLAQGLRAPADDDGGGDQLHAQRQRTRLLAAFDRGLLFSAPRRGARRRLLWPVAVAAVAGGLFVMWRGRPAREIVPPASVVVRAADTAVWSKRRAGTGRQEIALQRGQLWIKVDHTAGDGRLVVLLPDGELEDIGTTFTVTAEGGRTTRVEVHEGSVLLRLRGQPAVTIGSGDRWMPDTTPAPDLATPARPTPTRRLPAPTRPSVRPRRALAQAAPEDGPAIDFRAAMSALDAGDNRQAGAAFARFLARHPRDSRAEDASYLRVIALQRLGAHGEMQRAAQEYLRRHPTGFRRTEVERLSRLPEPPGR